jgi:hypothetical protein
MPAIAEINARVKEASGQVSTLTRSLALGFLAVSWTLFTAHDEPLHSMAANVNRYLILGLAACSVLFLACDLLHYVAITSMAEEAAERAKKVNPSTADYDVRSVAYKAQAPLYHAKFWIVASGSILLLTIFVFLLMPIKTTTASAPQPTPPCVASSPKDHTATK